MEILFVKILFKGGEILGCKDVLPIPQRIDRIQQRCLVGGVESEEYPYHRGKAEGEEDGERGDDDGPPGKDGEDF